MRYMGLDLGTKTLGVALTDSSGTIASPLKTIKYDNINSLIDEVINIIEEKNVSEIALGLPKNMDNSMGFAADRSLSFKEKLEQKTDVKVTLVDERLSTVEAQNYLINEGMRREKRNKIIDAVAASVILNTFIRMKGK